ncbi:aminotransferase class I/II-fold pyridoxal phosphate-dependent enzyme [Candidatus Dojkabacteria bacterium]|uniref:Aminotransferase class I/II-fold pyridoxal phosphate-dependent enzyme n=1 Tax=Candidatus Dojkabacteria bacterium TaxID=2099670 RepID=A0A955RJX2_9BACT|nr:aminotransferase class I/II-fold pyridoxal phosphate-dependent enzyme [Candidatus Dojkabacteria bacterium]
MFSFKNDYSELAHPKVTERLLKHSHQQNDGYGEDMHSQEVTKIIHTYTSSPSAAVHLVSGGTQANIIGLSSMLKPYESVIACTSGHISTHESGAIEATGHKINEVPNANGKITVEQIDRVVKEHNMEHMVLPRAVFISQATEFGSIYSKKELTDISNFCKQNNLYLYLDGARIGHALMSNDSDLTLEDIGSLTDMFYIGGTKNGALFGEAIVIPNTELQNNFRFIMKQRGGLLAKTHGIALQFLALFEDDLYFQLAQYANTSASKLADGIKAQGYDFFSQSSTNQIFPIFPKTVIQELEKKFDFYLWENIDERTAAIRLVTSWATPESAVEEFLSVLKNL